MSSMESINRERVVWLAEFKVQTNEKKRRRNKK